MIKKKHLINMILLSLLGCSAYAIASAPNQTIEEQLTTGAAQLQTDHPAAAFATFQNALTSSQSEFGEASAEYARVSLRVGASLLDTTQSRKAGQLLGSAHEIFLNAFGQSHLETAVASFYLGMYWMKEGRELKALPLLLASLPALEQTNSDPSILLDTHSLIVNAYERTGKSDQATYHLQQISKIAASGYQTNLIDRPIYAVSPSYPVFSHCAFVRDANLGPCNHYSRDSQASIVFDIDRQGIVTNARVASKDGDSQFAEAALSAIEQFRYAPQFVDGQLSDRRGVMYNFDSKSH